MTKREQELEKRVTELEREVAELKARPAPEYHYHYHAPLQPVYTLPPTPLQPFQPVIPDRITCKAMSIATAGVPFGISPTVTR
jgi:hypothetical protein